MFDRDRGLHDGRAWMKINDAYLIKTKKLCYVLFIGKGGILNWCQTFRKFRGKD